MFLNKDIHSYFNPSYFYGYAGDEVEIIADHDNVKVVRHLGKKVGFPVNSEDLSTDRVKSELPIIANTIKQIATKPKSKKVVFNQPLIF